MKLGKLSLVAVMALGTSAFAIDNVKVNGEAKVIYQSNDVDGSAFSMFDKTASLANIGVRVGSTADLTKGVSAGLEVQAITTLGLENNLVQGVMATGSALDQWNMSQAWIAASLGNTTAKIGRMEIDTPLAFTEKWNVVNNTFEGLVLLNTDLPATTLVGAWVGKHNGMGGTGTLINSSGQTVSMADNSFVSFGAPTGSPAAGSGAYAFGAVNKSIPDVTAQVWYYDVVDVATAYWVQADAKVAGMVTLGAQYASMNPDAAGVKTSTVYAVKAGADVAGVNVYAAYSSTEKGSALGFSNVATGDKTKIYTGLDSIYMDGIVTRPGTNTYKVGASTTAMDVKLAAAYTSCETTGAANNDIAGLDLSASGKVGPVSLMAIYTQVYNEAASLNYGGVDRDTIRLIGTYKF